MNGLQKSADPAPGLELFDEDVEHTRKGWPQLYVAAGIMHLDADGFFSTRLPNGDDVTIVDFDRAGLKDSDWTSISLPAWAISHWTTVNTVAT